MWHGLPGNTELWICSRLGVGEQQTHIRQTQIRNYRNVAVVFLRQDAQQAVQGILGKDVQGN